MIRESVRDEISCLHPHKPEYLSRTEVLALLKIGEEIDKALGFRKRMILDFN
jgi:hypothetical protein